MNAPRDSNTTEPQDGHALRSIQTTNSPDSVLDPVCGMTVNPAATAHHAHHDGSEYHFCSAGCREKFVADPAKYLSSSAATPIASVPPAPVGTIYTCPMHPQIRQQGPGTCPICGMALEPEMPSLEEEDNPELRDFSRRFWWTLPLSLIVLTLAMIGPRLTMLDTGVRTMIEFVLSTPVVLWGAWPFFVRCAKSLRTGNLNMWTLIGIGVGAAYGYSVAAALLPDLFPVSFREHGRVDG